MRMIFAATLVFLFAFTGLAHASGCQNGECIGKPCKTFAEVISIDEITPVVSCIPVAGNQNRDCTKSKCVYVTTARQVPIRSDFYVDMVSLSAVHAKCKIQEPDLQREMPTSMVVNHSPALSACNEACHVWCTSVKGGMEGALVETHFAHKASTCSCTYLK